MKPLGTVVSTEESPTTQEFSFVLEEGAPVKKNQFIQTTSEEGTVFGLVREITRANRYFERAESVAEYEKESSISTHFPVKAWEYAIGEVRILGLMNKVGDKYKHWRVSLPPSPGAKVLAADEQMLNDFIGFQPDGLMLGKLQNHDVQAKVSMTRLLQKHLAILAMSGAGKCVTYDTPIMLADGTHRKIGELADSAFGSGEIQNEDGTEITFPKENISVLSLDDKYRMAPNAVYAITRRRSPENLVVLKTRTGRRITLTTEHPVLTVTGKGPEWKKAGDVKEGEHIAVPRELSFGEGTEVNLLDFYKDSEKMCVFDKQTLLELKKELSGKKLMVPRRIACQLAEGCMSIRMFHEMCIKAGREDLFYQAEKLRYFNSKTPIPAKLKLERRLGRFIGYLMGDGHVSGNCLNLSALNPEIREDFRKISMELFGFEASQYQTSVRVHSKALVCVLNDVFGVKPSAEEKTVSPAILSANKEFVSGFLTGLFDTDGSVSLKKPEIEFCSKGRSLATGTMLLLLRFGVLPVLKIKHNKKYDRDYHIVYARGSSNLGIFMREISFVSYKKRSRLEKMASLKPNTNIDVIPAVEPLLADVMAKLRISESETARRARVANNLSRYGSGGDALSRETFGKIARELSERAEELWYLCVAADTISIPSSKPDAILSSCGEIKNSRNLQYKQISGCCDVSAPTVKRMLSGETAITDSILEIGRGVSAAASHQGTEQLENMLGEHEEFASFDAMQLFKLADGMNLPYDLLDSYSGLHKGAWASFKRGDRPLSLESKTRMVCGLRLAASEIKKEVESCRDSLDLLLSLGNSSILWDGVEEITPLKSKHDYVYDIALKGNHNFFAGEIPLVIHNSHLSSVILEELLDRKKEDGRIAIVVIDIHGEYIGFKSDPRYGKQVRVVEGKSISVPFSNLNPELLGTLFPDMTGPARVELGKILKQMAEDAKQNNTVYGMQDLIARVETAGINKNTKDSLMRPLYELLQMRLVHPTRKNPNLYELRPGEMLILDLSDLDDQKRKKAIVTLIASRLFKLRRKGSIPPFMLLVEEAHNFAPERSKAIYTPSKSIIEKIAREGRKFGAALCVVSQRPVQLSTTTLSQCNTHIILRVTNPNDLDHIRQSSEGLDDRTMRSITSLKVGEGIIVGEAINYPAFVEIRDRKSKKMEKGEPLHLQAIKFDSDQQKKEEEEEDEIEAFLD